MTRISWVFVVFACFTFSGCGQGSVEVADEEKVKTTSPVEDDLKKSSKEGMTLEEYSPAAEEE